MDEISSFLAIYSLSFHETHFLFFPLSRFQEQFPAASFSIAQKAIS